MDVGSASGTILATILKDKKDPYLRFSGFLNKASIFSSSYDCNKWLGKLKLLYSRGISKHASEYDNMGSLQSSYGGLIGIFCEWKMKCRQLLRV